MSTLYKTTGWTRKKLTTKADGTKNTKAKSDTTTTVQTTGNENKKEKEKYIYTLNADVAQNINVNDTSEFNNYMGDWNIARIQTNREQTV